MLQYIKKEKIEMVVIGIWLLVLNCYKIFFHVVGIDTEQALISFDSNLNWTLGSGRFASALLRKVLMPYGFNYDIALVMTIIGWLSVCVLYQYCLQKYGNMNRWVGLLFSILYVSCPIWAEQNYFLCSAFVNVIGIICTVVAAYLLTENLQNGGRKSLICTAIIFVIISIGIYQALLYLVIANCIVFLTLNAYTKSISFKSYLLSGIKSMVVLFVATMGYFVCSKIAIELFYDVAVDYAGFTDASQYISGRVHWFDVDITHCWSGIWKYILDSISPDKPYGAPILVMVWCGFQGFLILRFFRKKKIADIMLIMSNFLLLLTIYLGCLLLGGGITVREQVVLPFVVAYNLAFLVNEIWIEVLKINGEKIIHKSIMAMFIVLGICVTLGWSNRQLQINYSDYVRYRKDVALADTIMNEVRKIGDIADKKVVFVGKNRWTLPKNCVDGEIIGKSILSWDYEGPVGVNYRTYGFLQSLGYEYEKPTIEDVKTINDAAQIDWREGNRIMSSDNYIIVNLNEF